MADAIRDLVAGHAHTSRLLALAQALGCTPSQIFELERAELIERVPGPHGDQLRLMDGLSLAEALAAARVVLAIQAPPCPVCGAQLRHAADTFCVSCGAMF